MTSIPEYIVSTGIVGSGEPSYATYVRRPSGSLRRVHSRINGQELLPLRPTRLEALEDLYIWLERRHAALGTGYSEYRWQMDRVWNEMQAEKGASE